MPHSIPCCTIYIPTFSLCRTSLTAHERVFTSTRLFSGGKADARVCGVKDRVVVLQELLANDGVDAGAATVGEEGVVLARAEAELAVLGGWDQVLGRGEGEGGRSKLDVEVGGGLGGEGSEARLVGRAAGGRQELVVGLGGDVDERGAGVDNACGRRGQRGRAVGEAGNGDAPVAGSLAALEGVEVGDGARVLGAVGAAKSQLAVGVVGVAAGLGPEGDAEHLAGDGALAVEVVHEGGHLVGAVDGVCGQVNGAKSDDAVDAVEAGRLRGSANGLALDGQAAEADIVRVLSAGERAGAISDLDGGAGGLAGGRRLALALGTAPEVGS